jgi:hypothetical protein
MTSNGIEAGLLEVSRQLHCGVFSRHVLPGFGDLHQGKADND